MSAAIEKLKARAKQGPECKVVHEDDGTVVFAGSYLDAVEYMRTLRSIAGWHIMSCRTGRYQSFVL